VHDRAVSRRRRPRRPWHSLEKCCACRSRTRPACHGSRDSHASRENNRMSIPTRQNHNRCINRLVASSTNASSVHFSERSSNHACSNPSICTNSPQQSRRRRG
jgi:hypothetical protein